MKYALWNMRLQTALTQRNVLSGLSMLLAISNVICGIIIFYKPEKIILVPPVLRKEIWIEGGRISPSYLEQLSLWHAHLILDNSESTAAYSREVLLRHVVPSSYGKLKKQLLEEEEKFRSQQLSTAFKPVSMKAEGLIVFISGDLESFVGSKKINEKRETYKIEYEVSGGLVQLKNFQVEVKNEL